VGDNASGPNSQSLDTLLGKLLRINADGTIPNDNPFFQQATGVIARSFSPSARVTRELLNEIAHAVSDHRASFIRNHKGRDDHVRLTIVFERNRHPRAVVSFGQINR
jgi:hypothetical protein